MKKRRSLTILIVLFTLTAFLVYAGGKQETKKTQAAAEGFSWTKYSGTNIRFVVETNVADEFLLENLIKPFEEKTGITVTYDNVAATQARQKAAVELSARSASLDGFMTLPNVVGRQFWLSGYIEPLDDYVNDPNLTQPGYDFNDFTPALRDISRRYFDGELGCIPLFPQTQILYYVKDYFEKYGIPAPPETLQDMEAAAKKITQDTNKDGEIDQFGVVWRGRDEQAVTQLSYYLFTMGGKWRDENGCCNLTAPECVQALDFYGRMLRNYGPPGAVNAGHVEAQALFMQGNAAMYSDTSNRRGLFEDASKSKLAGRLGYSTIPKYNGHVQMMLPLNGYFLSAYSQKKEAAWQYVQWMTNKENCLKIQLAGFVSPRVSSWESEEYRSAEDHQDWADAVLFGLRTGLPLNVPEVIAVSEARAIIGKAIQSSILGMDVEKAAQEACRSWNELLKKTGDLPSNAKCPTD
jgi:multiple sugar transport system substrate-binding protein